MTPRERAEALGWYTNIAGDWYDADHRVVLWLTAVGVCWVRAAEKYGPWPTEDEALAHALLLRDVVLS